MLETREPQLRQNTDEQCYSQIFPHPTSQTAVGLFLSFLLEQQVFEGRIAMHRAGPHTQTHAHRHTHTHTQNHSCNASFPSTQPSMKPRYPLASSLFTLSHCVLVTAWSWTQQLPQRPSWLVYLMSHQPATPRTAGSLWPCWITERLLYSNWRGELLSLIQQSSKGC